MKHLVSTAGLALALGLLCAAPAGRAAEAPASAPAAPPPPSDGSPPWSGKQVLDDPEWQKSFLGSYGFLSGAEPQISESEIEVLRQVIDLMKTNTRAAITVLEGSAGPGSSAALDFVLANLQFQEGDQDAALESYERALGKFPDFRRAHKNLGLLLVQKGDFKGALGHLSKAVELGDRDGRSYGLIGYCYVNLENYLAAEAAYRNAILDEPDVRDWKLGLARSLLAMQRYQEAASLFQSLIDADPKDASAWLLQANAYVGLDRPMDAAVNLEAVRMMGQAQSQSLVLLGDIYMNAGMPDLAKSAYLEVVKSDQAGTQFATATRAAELLVRGRSYEEAAEILATTEQRYAGKLSQDQELQLLTLKAKVARGQGRDQEAAKLLESIALRDGTRGDALLELASYYRSQGNREKALLLIERAERIDDSKYQALLEHAQLLVADKQYADAAEVLRRAIAIKSEPRVEGFLARVEEAARR